MFGQQPPLNYSRLKGHFNLTMALRQDADIPVVHGRTVKLAVALSDEQLEIQYKPSIFKKKRCDIPQLGDSSSRKSV